MPARPSKTIGILSSARLAFSERDGLARTHYLSRLVKQLDLYEIQVHLADDHVDEELA
jgi:hypothetical protein